MPDVTETALPGVGVRHEFTTESGDRVGVISHRGGRREVVVYDEADPDACAMVLHLSADDTRTMAELLGATRVSEVLSAVQQEIEGLAIDWIRIDEHSSWPGRSIADGQIRTRTGVSIVAVVRGTATHPSPEPTFVFVAGDVAVAVGTVDGLRSARSMLEG